MFSSLRRLRNVSLPLQLAETLSVLPSLCVFFPSHAQSYFPLNRTDETKEKRGLYSPRKQNVFLFYNHIATYGEQLVVVIRRGVGMRHLYKKVVFFPETLFMEKEVFLL